jgi:hypothetical protein
VIHDVTSTKAAYAEYGDYMLKLPPYPNTAAQLRKNILGFIPDLKTLETSMYY